GRFWLLFIVCIIAANDTFAYYVGKGFGKHKLSPGISPKKTVEGALGGLIGGVAVALIFNKFFLTHISPKEISMLAVSIGILGQLSDLFESLIKRSAGVKDSGGILPGHGGMLDRIDSLIFPSPFLYYYLIYFRL
ncbi:MAG: phosphatidate cytidylyltransferase, partial [Deltaproteobacteria bacterium]